MEIHPLPLTRYQLCPPPSLDLRQAYRRRGKWGTLHAAIGQFIDPLGHWNHLLNAYHTTHTYTYTHTIHTRTSSWPISMAIKRPNANLLKCNFHIAVACCMFAACLRSFVFLFFLFYLFFGLFFMLPFAKTLARQVLRPHHAPHTAHCSRPDSGQTASGQA